MDSSLGHTCVPYRVPYGHDFPRSGRALRGSRIRVENEKKADASAFFAQIDGGHDRFRTYDLYSVNVALSP